MKEISIHTTIYDLVKTNPDLVAIMVELGFKDISNPMMLNTVGKIMTIAKAAKMKKVPLIDIYQMFGKYDYTFKEEITNE